tara:strand:- start:156 stop:1658 length:1503 start_codon:yes stop_codon:yes gene_type:complete
MTKISNLPKASSSSNNDLIVVVQGDKTKSISKESFLGAVERLSTQNASNIKGLQSQLAKKSINKKSPVFTSAVKALDPTDPNHLTTKKYVDKELHNVLRDDGTKKLTTPLAYYKQPSVFSNEDLISKKYADDLLLGVLKTIVKTAANSLPSAAAGDCFIMMEAFGVFAENGPEVQMGDILICIENSKGGSYSSAGHQFAILNTNVVTATEQNSGILKIATDREVEEYSSDASALTPKKLKDSLLSNSFFNRTSINVSSYTVVESDRGILAVDNRRNSCTITLPSITSLKDPEMFKLVVKDEFGQADIRNITVKAAGSSIDGDTAKHLSNKYQAITIYNDGKNYYIENNTHATTSLSEKVLQAGVVYPSVTGSAETLYQASVDLSDFDLGQGFVVEVSGFFAANTNTKTLAIEIDGTVTVTNTTTSAPNSDFFVARVTVMKEPRYAVAYGYLLLEGIAADTYVTNGLNMDWSSSIIAKVTANCATAITDIQVYSMLVEPLK